MMKIFIAILRGIFVIVLFQLWYILFNLLLIYQDGMNRPALDAYIDANWTITTASEGTDNSKMLNYTTPLQINTYRNVMDYFLKELSKKPNVVEYYNDYQQHCSDHFTAIPDDRRNTSLSFCPCLPETLDGPLKLGDLLSQKPSLEVEKAFLELSIGGYWQPRHCIARRRVAMVIPFKDREEHLTIFLRHIHPILQVQLLEYRIYIIEQVEPSTFNKAAMMNIGFWEARQTFQFDCIIFHDVDMLLEDNRNMYTCRNDLVLHLAPYVDKFDYKLPLPLQLFGGAISLTPEQFVVTNGFSNHYWGWGGEDDDMLNRVKAAGLTMKRPPEEVARYTMIKHNRDKDNPPNPERFSGFVYRPRAYAEDGVSKISQLYTIRSRLTLKLYTKISVALTYSP